MAYVLSDIPVIDLPAQAMAMTSRSHRCMTATRIEKDNLFRITDGGPLVLLYEFTMILSIPFVDIVLERFSLSIILFSVAFQNLIELSGSEFDFS
jgi:hypothetical protein